MHTATVAKMNAKSKDRLTKERRSWNMSRIKSKDTTPEKIVRSMLHKMGCRFRLHMRIAEALLTYVVRSKPTSILIDY